MITMKQEGSEKKYLGLKRNYYEITCCKNFIRSWIDLKKIINKYDVNAGDFVVQCKLALHDAFIINLIKVLDKNKDSYTFHSLIKDNEELYEIMEEIGLSIELVDEYTDKLKLIRDNFLLHIDKKYLRNSNEVWLEADLDEKELVSFVYKLYDTIEKLYFSKPGLGGYLDYQTDSALEYIAEYLQKNYISK
jgi:hypothetical protein